MRVARIMLSLSALIVTLAVLLMFLLAIHIVQAAFDFEGDNETRMDTATVIASSENSYLTAIMVKSGDKTNELNGNYPIFAQGNSDSIMVNVEKASNIIDVTKARDSGTCCNRAPAASRAA